VQVLTRRAAEEVVLDHPGRVVVLETAADEVKLGVVDATDGFAAGVREVAPDAGRSTGRPVQVIAPYGETIEIDG
jgi:hypothetical protein